MFQGVIKNWVTIGSRKLFSIIFSPRLLTSALSHSLCLGLGLAAQFCTTLCHTLTGPLSLLDTIVGIIDHLCQLQNTLSHVQGSLGHLGHFLWLVNSCYPHCKNGLEYMLRTSLTLTSKLYFQELEKI